MRVRPATRASVREPRENRGRLRHCNGIQTPRATGREIGWEGGSEVQTRSQDIGLAALVVAAPGRTGMPVLAAGAASFSVEEKDEASLLHRLSGESVGCLHSPFWRGLKARSSSDFALVSQPSTCPGRRD